MTLTLGQLQAEGLIAVERRRVVLLDLERLRREVEKPADPPAVKQRAKTTPT